MNQADSFAEFLEQREEASTAFVNGDFDPLEAMSTDRSPATIFGPRGDAVEGAANVNSANAAGAARFRRGSTNSFQIMHSAGDGAIAYWAGIQHSVVRMKGQDQPIPIDLRVTEIFRHENDGWKLIHRHADQIEPSRDSRRSSSSPAR